jgi:hypothetical protein
VKRTVGFTPLTLSAVRQAAAGLMLENGLTTTLEVKNRLRSQGYWALQAVVARMMQALAGREGWHVEAGPRFRIYRLPRAAAGFGWGGLILN